MGKIGKVYYIYLDTDHGWDIQRGAGCYMRTRRVQDKAWVIDLHLVKHSGIGQSSGGVGWAKVEWWVACFHVFKAVFSPYFGIAAADGQCSGFI